MAQMQTFTWTNPAGTVGSKLFTVNFEVAQVTIYDQSNLASSTAGAFKQALWIDTMPEASAMLQTVSGGSFITSGGISPIRQGVVTGASITAAAKADPGTITVDQPQFFQSGDVIKAVGVSDDQSGTTWNGQYTIASIAGNVLTLSVDTTAFSGYLGGGYVSIVTRVIDGVATAWPIVNRAVGGVQLGTSVVGGSNDVLHMVVLGKLPVT